MHRVESVEGHKKRPIGLSAFVRCKNEEEFIVASLLSAYRVFDEILVALNNSTDRTRELIDELLPSFPKVRVVEYPNLCAPIGTGYLERVAQAPESSLARFYNWRLGQTTYSHVCKWDGDMIATPEFERVSALTPTSEVIIFDGYDVLGQTTTSMEPRIFRYDPSRARYVDWELYEVLQHDYSGISYVEAKCYLHMKLVKKEWRYKTWSNPNDSATSSIPDSSDRGRPAFSHKYGLLRRAARMLLRR